MDIVKMFFNKKSKLRSADENSKIYKQNEYKVEKIRQDIAYEIEQYHFNRINKQAEEGYNFYIAYGIPSGGESIKTLKNILLPLGYTITWTYSCCAYIIEW